MYVTHLLLVDLVEIPRGFACICRGVIAICRALQIIFLSHAFRNLKFFFARQKREHVKQ